jgi:hypothetical protein
MGQAGDWAAVKTPVLPVAMTFVTPVPLMSGLLFVAVAE